LASALIGFIGIHSSLKDYAVYDRRDLICAIFGITFGDLVMANEIVRRISVLNVTFLNGTFGGKATITDQQYDTKLKYMVNTPSDEQCNKGETNIVNIKDREIFAFVEEDGTMHEVNIAPFKTTINELLNKTQALTKKKPTSFNDSMHYWMLPTKDGANTVTVPGPTYEVRIALMAYQPINSTDEPDVKFLCRVKKTDTYRSAKVSFRF
jgi:hypothetical protein